jgi:hypothetical protein
MAENLVNLYQAMAKIVLLTCWSFIFGFPLVIWAYRLQGNGLNRGLRAQVITFLFSVALVVGFALLAHYMYYNQGFWDSLAD